MGFYGNVTNTSKTTFSFDLIYPSRSEMDSQADKDGVFLGRYVLVDYGEDPIKGYFNSKDSLFYHTPSFTTGTAFYGQEGTIYQDINNALSAGGFYRYDINQQIYVPMLSKTPYQERFQLDVKNYGRGYDSTAWVKRYDPTANDGSGGYKYVAIAELNAVVPTFHMVVSKPNASPVPPYFDRDTTNIDYYLHMQGDFSTRVKEAQDDIKSDETAIRTRHEWRVDESGYQYYNAITEEVPADIYFNNAGFDEKIRYYDSDKVTYNLKDDKYQIIPGSPLKEIDYSKNTIGYDMGRSTRLYGNEADMGTYEFGTPEDDIYDWYVRLPGIGNAICKMWDKVFGDPGNDKKRYINKALCRNDKLSNLATYDKTTLMGMINTTQDLLGYHFIPFNDDHYYINKTAFSEIINSNPKIEITLTHEDVVKDEEEKIEYYALDCLFYDPKVTSDNIDTYYHYAYSPNYIPVTSPINPDSKEIYYYKDEAGIFHIANKANQGATDANGNDIDPLYNTYYTVEPRWIMQPLVVENHDTIYGLLNQIHKLLGTNAQDIRDFNSLQGTINIIKDIIDRINLNLQPGRLLHTNNQGVIETTDTYYPSSDVDATRVLVGKNPDHPWENRVRAIEIQSGNTSDTAWETSSGTIDTNENNNNTIAFEAGNKWIGLAVNPDTQLVAIRHMSSKQEKHDFATDVFIDDDIDGSTTSTTDCKITLPLVKTDNAGHVIGYSTKDIYIPYNYRNISLNEQSQAEDNITVSYGEQSADSTTDTFTFATGNRWIDAKIDEDSITHSHRLVPADTLKNNVVLNGNRRTPAEQVQNVFRYGLPQDKTYGANGNLDRENGYEAANTFNIPYIEVDKAGHVVAAETHTVEIPHIYNKISTGDVINDKATEGQAGHTIDTLADKTSVQAETLEEEIVYAPSNKWVRINAANTEGKDTVTFGHEIHTIVDTKPVSEDLDSSVAADKTFTTQVVNWDEAGHIIEYGTKTWTLPNSIRNINITGTVNDSEVYNPNGTSGLIEADYTSDTVNMSPANKWIRLTTRNNDLTFGHLVQNIATPTNTIYLSNGINYNTHEFLYDEAGHITEKKIVTHYLPKHVPGNNWIIIENTTDSNKQNTITYSHLEQGTAGSYGTNVTFAEFGGTVNLQGYKTDKTGHVVDYPLYTLTLPKGSYVPDDNTNHNGARVITGIGFTASSGEITSTSQNVGTLKLNGYVKLNTTTTAVVTADSTINGALAALDNRIETEEETRSTEITNLRMFKTVNVSGTALEADSNAGTLSIAAENSGIVLTPVASSDSFTIGHKTGHEVINGFYKFSTDAYGHISATTAITLDDLTGLGAATAENLNAHVMTVTNNPHKVTAEDVGLKNVTNESKATMFTNPVFTGIPEAPTAAAGTNTTQIATTAFVTDAVKTINDKVAWAADYIDFDALYAAVKQKLEEEYTLVPKEKEEEEIPTA